MDMHNELFTRYMNNECTVEEITELLRHFQIEEDEKKLKELIDSALNTEEIQGAYSEDDEINLDSRLSNLYVHLKQDIEKEAVQNVIVRPIIRWYSIAATIALFCCVGLGVLYLSKKDQKSEKGLVYQIRPGGNKATLVLADSEQMDLSKAKNGVLTKQGSISIDKTANGMISYSDGSDGNKSIVYNKIVVPNGRQYQVKLSDGTHIWLNSASTITYPTTFNSKTRNVTIIGEAYFEVAKNKNKPFIVTVNDITIQVLGTHFNVMAYQNEPSMKTTLLEGSVKVSRQGISKMITPGEEAQVITDINVIKANTEETIAWTNGSFMFANSEIQPIMRKVERWYNVKVVYNGETPTRHFNGEFSRNIEIKKLLNVLEQM